MKKITLIALLGSCTLLLADGASLFVKCTACHGKDGKTKALGKSGIIAGQEVDELIEDLTGYKAGTFDQYGMGATMKMQIGPYSKEEIKMVAEYISKLPK